MILLPGQEQILHDLPHEGLIGGFSLLVHVLLGDNGGARGVGDHAAYYFRVLSAVERFIICHGGVGL